MDSGFHILDTRCPAHEVERRGGPWRRSSRHDAHRQVRYDSHAERNAPEPHAARIAQEAGRNRVGDGAAVKPIENRDVAAIPFGPLRLHGGALREEPGVRHDEQLLPRTQAHHGERTFDDVRQRGGAAEVERGGTDLPCIRLPYHPVRAIGEVRPGRRAGGGKPKAVRREIGDSVAVAVEVRVEGVKRVKAVGPLPPIRDPVTVRVGTKTLTDTSARQFAPGASQTFEFRHKFEQPGAAVVSAVVEAGDDMPSDDAERLVVPVLDTLRVLIIDGDAPLPTSERGASYVSLALRPDLVQAAGRRDFLLETTIEDVVRAGTRPDFSNWSVIVLCNVARLSDASMKALAAHVRKGAGLLVLPGRKAIPEVYNSWSDGAEPLLPLHLGKWIENPPDSPALPLIDVASFSHDSLLLLRTSSELRRVAPLRRWQLEQPLGASPFTIARLNDGAPLFAMKTYGLGTVALSALPFDPSASDLPLRRAFVPLLHEMVYHIARPVQPELNVIPMDRAEIRLLNGRPPYDGRRYAERGKRAPEAPRADQTWLEICDVTSPRGEKFHGELRFTPEGTFLAINRSLVPGLYTVSSIYPQGFPKEMASVLTPNGVIAINVKSGTEESSLHTFTPEQQDAIRAYLPLSVATRKEDVLQLLNGSSFGAEIWRFFALILLAALIAEIAISRWIAIRRRSGEQIDVEFVNEGELGRASFKEALQTLRSGS